MDAQENRILTAILITAFVIGSIIIYFFISIIRQQRKNRQLHQQNIMAEIAQIEKERARIAHDLHDELGPLLSAVKMKINSFDLVNSDDKIQVDKTNGHLDDALKRIREISFNLLPNSLIRKGVISAVKEYVDYLNADNNRIKFSFNGADELKISEQNSVNLYRIIQEVVHNTIKHAGATELKIELVNSEKMLELKMQDNGIGFDYVKESDTNIGFGLKSLFRRTEIMNGKMYIESQSGRGTAYSFEIPF
jgi:signal transduction histidine kinase